MDIRVNLTKENYCFSENYANWTATKAIFLTRLYDFIQNNGKKKKELRIDEELIRNFKMIQPASPHATFY